MFDPEFQKKALSLVMGFIMEFSGVSSEPEPIELTADNLNVSTISVSCLKVTWDSEPDRDYYVTSTAHDDNYAYGDNIYFEFRGNDLWRNSSLFFHFFSVDASSLLAALFNTGFSSFTLSKCRRLPSIRPIPQEQKRNKSICLK